MEALPLFLDRLTLAYIAIIISVTVVLMFGEVRLLTICVHCVCVSLTGIDSAVCYLQQVGPRHQLSHALRRVGDDIRVPAHRLAHLEGARFDARRRSLNILSVRRIAT